MVKIFSPIAVIAVLCSVAGCSNRGVSRATAANLIMAAVAFPVAENHEVFRDYANVHAPDVAHFLEAGLLTSTSMNDPVFPYVTLGFADSAKKYELPTDYSHNPPSIVFKVCDIVFGEVTGLQVNEEAGTAVVEYSLRRTNWSPFGEYYRRTEPNAFPEVIAQRAGLTRYDDGWRITPPGR